MPLADEEMDPKEIERMFKASREEEGEREREDSPPNLRQGSNGNGSSRDTRHVVEKVEFEPFTAEEIVKEKFGIEAFNGVNMQVSGELGKARIKVRDLLKLQKGSTLKLEQLADENLMLLVNEAVFAKGEVVVIGDRFGIRITSFMDEDAKE